MITISHLLQAGFLPDFTPSMLCFLTAFIFTLLIIPAIIFFTGKLQLYDMPGTRKLHQAPVPTMGGIAIVTGMITGLILWMPLAMDTWQVAFFFCVITLMALGVMDDLKDMPAKYKFMIQAGVALLMAVAGIRITSLEGIFGIHELPVAMQYFLTVLLITGVTNAFNLIDGIDGLAGGIGFMSLATTGIFLLFSGDQYGAAIAIALSGSILAFLYFNFNPARIFMGDTGSLVLGFVTAVLCIRLQQINAAALKPVLHHSPVFILGIVLIPVFDTIRVFYLRLRKGISPFTADRTHIHHLLTNRGIGHAACTRIICGIHAFILIQVYLVRHWPQEIIFLLMTGFMMLVVWAMQRLPLRREDKNKYTVPG